MKNESQRDDKCLSELWHFWPITIVTVQGFRTGSEAFSFY